MQGILVFSTLQGERHCTSQVPPEGYILAARALNVWIHDVVHSREWQSRDVPKVAGLKPGGAKYFSHPPTGTSLESQDQPCVRKKAFRFGEVALRVPPNGLRRQQSIVAVVSMAPPIEKTPTGDSLYIQKRI
jgi:hypothetical protein